MTSNQGRPAGPNPRDDYEATVLDFLDREMATVQQAQKPNKQSEEVDALVTDLLKQVITESDQGKGADKPLFDQDELFVGLPSGSQKPANLDSSAFSVPSAPRKEKAEVEAESVKRRESPWETAATQTTHAVFGSSAAATPRKFPVKAAAAVVGLALAVGGAAYFFRGNWNKAPQSRPAPAQVAKSELPAAPVLPQPAAPPAVTPTPPPSKSHAAPALKPVPAPVKTTQPVSQQPQSTKPAPANTNATANGNTKPEPTPAKAAEEQKPPVVQPAPAVPPPAPAAAVVEKPPSQPVVENAAPEIPEKKPAPTPQMASVVNELPPPAPAPAPAPAAAPVVSRNLIAAVPISQASPVYPELALRTRSSGQVVLELQIDDQGKVIKATPVSGPAIFHNAAVAAAMKWRYRPASISGVNVSSQSRVTMTFNLKK